MRIPVYERQVGIGPLPNGYVNTSAGADAYGAGVGQAVQGLGEHVAKMAADLEDARTLERFNQLKRDSLSYHEDPNTGVYNTQLGDKADGLTARANQWLGERAGELEKGLSARARQNFRRMAGEYMSAREGQNSRFEAGQIRQYQEDVFENSRKLSLDSVSRDTSDEAAERARQEIYAAAWTVFKDRPKEAWDEFHAETENDIAGARLSAMIQQDPVKAKTWLEEHKGEFTGAGYLKAKEAADKAAKSYEVQAFVDEWVKDYPLEREEEGVREIRRQFRGPEEEERVRAYRQRLDEMSISENWERQEEARVQKENRDRITLGMMNGVYPTYDELTQKANSGELSVEGARQLQNMLGQMATRANVEKSLSRSMGNWAGMEQVQRDEAVMRKMAELGSGLTNEQRQGVVNNLLELAFTPDITKNEFEGRVRDAYLMGWITTREKDEFLGMLGTMKEEQRAFVSAKKTELEARLRRLFDGGSKKTDATKRSLAIATARGAFNSAVEPQNLDYRSGTYRKDVMEAMRAALLQAVDASGNAIWNEPEGSRVRTLTEFGGRFTALDDVMKVEGESVEEYTPRFTMDNVNLPTEEERQQAAAPRATAREKASYEKFKGAVDSSAEAYGVDAELVRAIIQVESGWKPGAVSPKGAQGLMQLMPPTAAGLGVSDAFDPEQNIRGGTQYIAGLIKKYGGDMEKALAAYNAGPGRVDAVDKGKKKLPAETVNYVKNVMALYRKYKGGTKNAGARLAAAGSYRNAGEVFNGFEN